ncbi:hypothetical protein HAX54_014054 [Datura stramonium]|uniref:Uncharacterized protein n=1 Tax=Datura stramonium TaxID=4076 RepID=A0ABS8TPD4_DATST|nr:hypothetical protein [Datura stramonium]
MDIEDKQTGEIRTEKVEIQYDYLPKYYKECKLQGHAIYECPILHPELNQKTGTDNGDNQGTSEKAKGQKVEASEGKKKEDNQRINSQPIDSFPRKLASGKIVGNPNNWDVVTNKKGAEQETMKSGAKGSNKLHTNTLASEVQSNREHEEEPKHESVTRQVEEEQELQNQVQLQSQEIP